MSSCVNIIIIIITVVLKIGITLKHLKPVMELRGVKLCKVGEDGVGTTEDEFHPATGGGDFAAESNPGKGVVDEADAEEAEAVREAREGGDGNARDDGVSLDDVAAPRDVVDGGSEETGSSGIGAVVVVAKIIR